MLIILPRSSSKMLLMSVLPVRNHELLSGFIVDTIHGLGISFIALLQCDDMEHE